MKNKGITAILTGYNRPQNIPRQLDALRRQTVKPDEIMLWYNMGNTEQVTFDDILCVHLNDNLKFHGRFALAMLAKTEYVAIFDDDTIPGIRWFESCLKAIDEGHDGILGCTGEWFNEHRYQGHTKVGWNGVKSNKTEEVDLVGHGWFAKKDHYRYMWYEEPFTYDTGEDIQLSALAKIHGGIKTYVPPHPESDLSIWGSIDGWNLGMDMAASWRNPGAMTLRDEVVMHYLSKGWITVNKV